MNSHGVTKLVPGNSQKMIKPGCDNAPKHAKIGIRWLYVISRLGVLAVPFYPDIRAV
jgi:hypothetical protein